MKALLIIDMQKISFGTETPRYEAENVFDRINLLAHRFRKAGDMVIFIRHDGRAENFCIPGTREWEIVDELELGPDDLFIDKTANDAFYRSDLLNMIRKYAAEEVIITGCATDFCVDATIKSALVNDLNVTVIADGHTTGDRPGLSAMQVIDHYNWVWSEMYATGGRIRIMKTGDFINSL